MKLLYHSLVIILRYNLMKFHSLSGACIFMQRSACRLIFVLSSFLIVGCSTDYAALDGDVIAMEAELAHIENEPITRLSFVPVDNSYDEFDVVLHQGGEAVSQIMPASGDENVTEKPSE